MTRMTTETAIKMVDWQSESDLDSIRNSCDVFVASFIERLRLILLADLETGFFSNCWLLQDKSNCLARGYELSGVWCPEEKMNLRGQLTSASVCLSVYFSPTRPGFHSNILHLGNISRLPSSNFLPRSISQRGKVSKVLHLRAFWPPPPTPVLHLSHLES